MEFGYTLRLYKDGEKFFGPGVADLLHAIQRTGSLRQAAASMHMAYSKAWHIVKNAEKALGCSLVLTQAGGKSGGGAELTEAGARFLETYDLFRKRLKTEATALFDELFGTEGKPG